MSDLSGQNEQTTLQDGSIAGRSTENLTLEDNTDAPDTEVVETTGATPNKTNTEPTDAESVTGPAQIFGQNGQHDEKQEAGVLTEGDQSEALQEMRSPTAEEVEKEASEHLARRAAEMTVDNGEQGDALRNNEELPPSPPPPTIPTKDAPSPAQKPLEEEFDEKHPPPSEDPQNDLPEPPQGTAEATGLEIQNIMEQFREGMGGPGENEIMSPRLERQQPVLVLPPRTSSLENRERTTLSPQTTGGSASSQPFSPEGPAKPPSMSGGSLSRAQTDDTESITSARAGSIFQPPPPSPDPEPALPFDFHRFLEQLRHRTADPVARFLRSFLNEFGKKQWMVHEQVKIISDFLEFIAKKMAQCEVWRTVSDAEFDNAREGMEKLVMNRLYYQTFSPAIPSPVGNPRHPPKGVKYPSDIVYPQGQGRRGQHQEDVERDEVIAQKIKIYGWIREEHLDMQPINEKGRKFLTLAQKELLKISSYRAPRDKVICVLNCCKVIFGFLKNSKGDQSADAFIPLLIYTVLRADPEHLVSNVQYIWRFRNQEKLGGEAGYYMSSLMGVVTFIENLDRTNLTISDEEFEINVEQAVSAIAETNKAEEYEEKTQAASEGPTTPMQRLSEKSGLSRPEVTPKNSMDGERSSPRKPVSREKSQHRQQASTDTVDDFDAVTGLLKTIGKPLSTIGRIFSDDGSHAQQQNSSLRPASTPLPGSTPRATSPVPKAEGRKSSDGRPQNKPGAEEKNSAANAAARQASAEAAQARKVRAQEHKVVVE